MADIDEICLRWKDNPPAGQHHGTCAIGWVMVDGKARWIVRTYKCGDKIFSTIDSYNEIDMVTYVAAKLDGTLKDYQHTPESSACYG